MYNFGHGGNRAITKKQVNKCQSVNQTYGLIFFEYQILQDYIVSLLRFSLHRKQF